MTHLHSKGIVLRDLKVCKSTVSVVPPPVGTEDCRVSSKLEILINYFPLKLIHSR
jgi:hypothetical protein